MMTQRRRYKHIAFGATVLMIAIASWILNVWGVPLLPHGWKSRKAWDQDHLCFTLRTLRFEATKQRDATSTPQGAGLAPDTVLPVDGWGTRLVLRRSSDGYDLRSAGRDTKFGTTDDLIWPSESAEKYLTDTCDRAR